MAAYLLICRLEIKKMYTKLNIEIDIVTVNNKTVLVLNAVFTPLKGEYYYE